MVIAVPLFPAAAFAQGETTSAIVGQVTDTTSAVVPGATVTVTNRDTGLERSVKTDDAGRFNFPQLKPGTYSVKAEAQGFEPQQIDEVVSGLGQKQTVDFMLKVAQSNQTVDVSGEAPSDQPRQSQHLHDVERAGAGEPAESRRRPDLPDAVCPWGSHQYGRQQQ